MRRTSSVHCTLLGMQAFALCCFPARCLTSCLLSWAAVSAQLLKTPLNMLSVPVPQTSFEGACFLACTPERFSERSTHYNAIKSLSFAVLR
jgi:hypothetical protein